MSNRPHQRFVAYYRVSTDRQGVSGLGLDAQRSTVSAYLEQTDGLLLDEFTEIESGKRKDRPELQEALAACRRHRAVLIIAKLDRLARNVHFIAGLLESGVEFVACDNPNANKMMVQLLAVFAEHEREMISQRTKDALAAAKARGVQLGQNGVVLAQKNREAAQAHARKLQPLIDEIVATGCKTASGIAEALNDLGIPTRGGGRWYAKTVIRMRGRG